MSSERDFSNYRAGDNVHELAGGIIPELADYFQVALSDVPTVEELGTLVGVVGKNKVLRENKETTIISIAEAAAYVDRSGILLPLEGSTLRGRDNLTGAGCIGHIIISGGVANWQDRVADLLVSKNKNSGIHIPVGNRIMNSATELTNPNIQTFAAKSGVPPTEAQYTEAFVASKLSDAGIYFEVYPYDTSDGQEIANKFAADRRDLFMPSDPHDGEITRYTEMMVAGVAGAGIMRAVQFRQAIQKLDPEFDTRVKYASHKTGVPTNNSDPDGVMNWVTQMHVLTDTISVARTREQIASPTTHQSPFTALRQVIVTAKSLQEAFGPKTS